MAAYLAQILIFWLERAKPLSSARQLSSFIIIQSPGTSKENGIGTSRQHDAHLESFQDTFHLHFSIILPLQGFSRKRAPALLDIFFLHPKVFFGFHFSQTIGLMKCINNCWNFLTGTFHKLFLYKCFLHLTSLYFSLTSELTEVYFLLSTNKSIKEFATITEIR